MKKSNRQKSRMGAVLALCLAAVTMLNACASRGEDNVPPPSAEATMGSTEATEVAQETPFEDTFDYGSLSFPDYSAENPVRYQTTDPRGEPSQGWQDFGTRGELKTHPWPKTTFTYQMYSYFLRSDLGRLYGDCRLPEKLEELPAFMAEGRENGYRILWYSMGSELPLWVELEGTQELTTADGKTTLLCAWYKTGWMNHITDQPTEYDWIIYFLEDPEGVFSSYAVRTTYGVDIRASTDVIATSYRIK